jgi:large subunit ribosomal protein L22
MTGPKTNERPGTRAQLRQCRMSAYKARQVLDLIRGVELERARDILEYCDREAAAVIGQLLASAVANAEHNDGQAAEELYVSACYADEGTTMKRWRPRARGRAGRIRKRTCHITVIVSRLPEGELQRKRAKAAAEAADRRARRVAGTRRARRQAEAGKPGETAVATNEDANDADTGAEDEIELSDGDGAGSHDLDGHEDEAVVAETEDESDSDGGDAEPEEED